MMVLTVLVADSVGLTAIAPLLHTVKSSGSPYIWSGSVALEGIPRQGLHNYCLCFKL
jgi:hypothetical protein